MIQNEYEALSVSHKRYNNASAGIERFFVRNPLTPPAFYAIVKVRGAFIGRGRYPSFKTKRNTSTRGRIPITKNIIVLNEAGELLASTYPKRARGLIKNGRARFIDAQTICLLACPSDETEDTDMDYQDPIFDGLNVEPQEDRHQEGRREAEQPESRQSGIPQKPTMQYVLQQIDRILDETAYLHRAIESIQTMEIQAVGGAPTDGRPEALSTIVRERESTNRQILSLLQRMYEDMTPPAPTTNREADLKAVRDLAGVLEDFDEGGEILNELIRMLFDRH